MLIIGNGRVITRDPQNPWLAEGAVVTEGRLIRELGPTALMRAKYPQADYVDARGGVIMPGLINAHTHIYSGLARGLSIRGHDPHTFYQVLDGMWWNIDRHLELEGTRASAYATIIDCIKNGVTTIFDHHASYQQIPDSLFAIAEVAKELASGPISAMRSPSGTAPKSAPRPSGKTAASPAGPPSKTMI